MTLDKFNKHIDLLDRLHCFYAEISSVQEADAWYRDQLTMCEQEHNVRILIIR